MEKKAPPFLSDSNFTWLSHFRNIRQTATTVKDVSPYEFVKAYSAQSQTLPHWTDIVKTATFKELAPYDPDWYYVRAASMARRSYLRQGIGVGGFRKIYGGRKRNGSRPPHFCKSSGAIAHNILHQLEDMKIVDVDPKGGRVIISTGRRDLDQVAGRIVVPAAVLHDWNLSCFYILSFVQGFVGPF
ncbi:hypothetical protein IFM89_007473 [Coptis chinensis]|uniref:40S ribosomal protein S19 n=1 Tax=Coptis chinensis TaxID=261450 RepID=A0A835LIK9_9MAGN|nr:hypothetical protein IFM89_007473 [Coptis chinensis]